VIGVISIASSEARAEAWAKAEAMAGAEAEVLVGAEAEVMVGADMVKESLRSLWIATGKCAEKEFVGGRLAVGERVGEEQCVYQTKPQTGSNWIEPLFGISHKFIEQKVRPRS
jgi:hypothetical protein